jgi:Carboxypeptidase regulatory-like domain/TonB-dependent Receptor Plug Domain
VKGPLSPSKYRKSSITASIYIFCYLMAMLALPVLAQAQDTGYISGTVTDKSGAAVAGAKVVIATVTGNINRETETNGDGAYTIAGLPGATYNITVTAAGFQKFIAQRVVLDVAQKSRVDVQLQVGVVTEEVVVNGEDVAQVDTQSAELTTTITGKQVNQLELNGRNFTQLVNLAPGVVSQTGQDEGTVGVNGNVAYSMNGGRTEYNNWELDGGDNMDNGSNTTLNVYPNLEAIAEFKVLTSNYGAQYGRNGSGTVEVETKSGSSSFHGSGFEYLRNDFFNANSWQNNGQGIARPEYKKHDFGYTIGGPIFIPHVYNNDKKKTFFFWSQEWRREKVPGSNINQNVPSDAERGGNFNDVCPAYTGAAFTTSAFPDCPFSSSVTNTTTGVVTATPFANNTVAVDPTGAALVALIPKANSVNGTYGSGQAAGTGIPAYVSNPALPTTWREELIRVDHNLSDTERLTFRYIHDSWKTVTNNALWGNGSSFDNIGTNFVGPGTSFVARLTSNFTPTLLNEFVASYTADHINLSLVGTNSTLPSGGVTLSPLFNNGLGGKLPAFSVGATQDGQVYGNGGFNVDTGYFPWKNANPTYTYRDNVTKTVGKHTLVFGGYFAAAQKNQDSTVYLQGILGFSVNPSFASSTGNPFADLLTGQVGSYSQTSRQPYFYDRYKILEPYFQDDWRVTSRLTLNLGLRWSIFGRYQELHDQEFNFSTGAFVSANAPQLFPFNSGNTALLMPGSGNFLNGIIQCGAKGVTTGCLKNKWINPGPRIGFAFDPKGDGKTAIRGGYGIFFEHMNGNEANAEALQGGTSPTVFSGSVSNIPGYALVGAGAQGAPSPSNTVSIPDSVNWPYVQQWNFGIQHELPSHIVLSVSYVGSKGTQLSFRKNLNQLQPVSAADNPYPAGTPITAADCASFSNPGGTDGTGLPLSATISTGATVTGQAAVNLFVACGNNAAAYYRPFQGYGNITRLENGANSIYNALQVGVQRTVGDLTLSFSYTYSHSIDDSSDYNDNTFVNGFDPRGNRASSNFDMRHNASISYVYALPFLRHSQGFKRTLLGGWQVSGITVMQSGLPFNVVNGSTFGDNAGVANGSIGTASRLDLVGNPYVVPASQQAQFAASNTFGVLRYNPAAFELPTGLTFGDVQRNEFRLPGRINFDFGLFKRFAFKERYAFEFRWENFNVFNHTQLDALAGNVNSSGVGVSTTSGCAAFNAGDPSCAGGGFLVLDGAHNPRIMQFGLRFQF